MHKFTVPTIVRDETADAFAGAVIGAASEHVRDRCRFSVARAAGVPSSGASAHFVQSVIVSALEEARFVEFPSMLWLIGEAVGRDVSVEGDVLPALVEALGDRAPLEDAMREVADGAAPVDDHELMQTCVDMGAYRVDLSGLAPQGCTDMVELARIGLRVTAERIAWATVSALRDTIAGR